VKEVRHNDYVHATFAKEITKLVCKPIGRVVRVQPCYIPDTLVVKVIVLPVAIRMVFNMLELFRLNTICESDGQPPFPRSIVENPQSTPLRVQDITDQLGKLVLLSVLPVPPENAPTAACTRQ
jgi:hypothetical protein